MNKYQERLLWLEWLKRSADRDLQLKEVYKHYKELVELHTPKKVIKTFSKYEGYYPQSNYWADCPNCKKTCYYDNETNDKFCPNCGQALDWSDR